MNRKFFILPLLLCALIFSTSVASADPIMAWTYEADGIFASYENLVGTTAGIVGTDPASLSWEYSGGVYDPGTADGYRTLTWGSGQAHSSIDIDPVSGILYTNDGEANGIVLTHYNFAIPATSMMLSEGTVRATLELTPYGIGSALPVLSTLLEFAFFETPNESPYAYDIFVLLNPEVTTESFQIGGYIYTFTFTGFYEITDSVYLAYLATQGITGTVYGWLTPENETTVVNTGLTISAVATPEPGTLMILGAGLLGLAVARRRFKK